MYCTMYTVSDYIMFYIQEPVPKLSGTNICTFFFNEKPEPNGNSYIILEEPIP